MKMIVKLVLSILGSALLAGCAPSIALNYNPSQQLITSIYAPQTSHSISVGPIMDVRGTSPTLVYTENEYTSVGTIPMPTYSKTPIADVIQQSIVTALISANYRVLSNSSDLSLSGELVSLSVVPSGGLSGVIKNQKDVTIRMNLMLINNRNRQLVWHEMVTGNSTIVPGVFYTNNKWLGVAFNNATSNLINNMMTQPEVHQALAH